VAKYLTLLGYFWYVVGLSHRLARRRRRSVILRLFFKRICDGLIASRTEGARPSNLLQREDDTRRILLEWEEAQRRQKTKPPGHQSSRDRGVKGQAQARSAWCAPKACRVLNRASVIRFAKVFYGSAHAFFRGGSGGRLGRGLLLIRPSATGRSNHRWRRSDR
jgi:hypothetical protein